MPVVKSNSHSTAITAHKKAGGNRRVRDKHLKLVQQMARKEKTKKQESLWFKCLGCDQGPFKGWKQKKTGFYVSPYLTQHLRSLNGYQCLVCFMKSPDVEKISKDLFDYSSCLTEAPPCPAGSNQNSDQATTTAKVGNSSMLECDQSFSTLDDNQMDDDDDDSLSSYLGRFCEAPTLDRQHGNEWKQDTRKEDEMSNSSSAGTGTNDDSGADSMMDYSSANSFVDNEHSEQGCETNASNGSDESSSDESCSDAASPILMERKRYLDQYRYVVAGAVGNGQLQMEVSLLLLLNNLKLPSNAFSKVLHWATECEAKYPGVFQAPPRKREVPTNCCRLIMGRKHRNEFKESSILWLPSKIPTRVFSRNFVDCITDLLNDPNVIGIDGSNISLPHPTDPFRSGPDKQPKYVRELHHGLWWGNTMDSLCTGGGRRMLLPLIFYIDTAQTDLNDRLPVTPLLMSLGILNTATRKRIDAWSTVAYLPNPKYHDKNGGKKPSGEEKLQNLHNCLRSILEYLEKVMEDNQAFEK